MKNIYDERWLKKPSDSDNFRTKIPAEEQALLTKLKARKILDLGSGDGTTLVHLASLGYEMTGIDYSRVGVEQTMERLAAQGLKGKIILRDIYKPFPFENGSFDAVISYQVINHNRITAIRKLLKEINRVLKKKGIFSVKVSDSATYAFTYHDGLCFDEFGSVLKLIEERTFIPIAGWEKGVFHYEFNKEILKKEIEAAGFRLLSMRNINQHVLANFMKK
jgi:SAM-dependent methyltransferase